MKITDSGSKGLKKSFGVSVPWEELEATVSARLANIAARAKIDGFRPGKVPMGVIQQRYGQPARNESIEDIVREAVAEAVKRCATEPAEQPKVQADNGFEPGKDVRFNIAFEVLPEIDAKGFDFNKIKLTRQKAGIEDKMIDEAVAKIADRNKDAEPQPAAYEAKNGDVAVVDFTGSVDGAEFQGGKGTDFALELGSHSFIEGFEDQLIGVKKGDRLDVCVTFPKRYHSKELAGKPALFKVEVKEVRTLKMPEMNDAFAKKLGFADLTALRGAVRREMEGEYAAAARSGLKTDLFNALEKMLDFPLPEVLHDREFGQIWTRVEEAKKHGSLDDDDKKKTDDELRRTYRDIAERRVRLGLFLAEVGKLAEVKLENADIERAIIAEARRFPGQERMVFDYYRTNPNMLEALKGPIFEDKVVDWIIEKASVSEKEVTAEELFSYVNAPIAPKDVKAEKKKPVAKKPAQKKGKKDE